MYEEDKIKAGILFCPADKELVAIKTKTHQLNMDYNNTYEEDSCKRNEIIHKIVGEWGQDTFHAALEGKG